MLLAARRLRDFNDAGVLSPADVHVAVRLTERGGRRRLGGACQLSPFADRAWGMSTWTYYGPRYGDCRHGRPCDISALPWPTVGEWTEGLSKSPLVAVGDQDDPSGCPLRLVGTWLYLDRYWQEERQIASNLRDSQRR